MTTLGCLSRVVDGDKATLVVVFLVQRDEIVVCNDLTRNYKRRTAEINKARDWLGAIQRVDGLGLGSYGDNIVT